MHTGPNLALTRRSCPRSQIPRRALLSAEPSVQGRVQTHMLHLCVCFAISLSECSAHLHALRPRRVPVDPHSATRLCSKRTLTALSATSRRFKEAKRCVCIQRCVDATSSWCDRSATRTPARAPAARRVSSCCASCYQGTLLYGSAARVVLCRSDACAFGARSSRFCHPRPTQATAFALKTASTHTQQRIGRFARRVQCTRAGRCRSKGCDRACVRAARGIRPCMLCRSDRPASRRGLNR